MKKKWLVGISLSLMLVLVGVAGCVAPRQVNLVSQQEGIWVTGQGKVTVVPDIATLSIGIEAQEATVAEAQSKAAEAMERVMVALLAHGVAEKDIQTQFFSIHPVTKWDWETGEETFVGYRVTNMVTAKIRDINKAGVIIDAVAEAGGDLTRIHGISFSVDDPSAYYDEARQKAMVDAKAKAEQLAELAGVTLGKPTYISESIHHPIYPQVEMIMPMLIPAPAPPTPIMPGEMEISLTVQVVYTILN